MSHFFLPSMQPTPHILAEIGALLAPTFGTGSYAILISVAKLLVSAPPRGYDQSEREHSYARSRMLLPACLPLAPRAGLDNVLPWAAPPSLPEWLHQLLVDSLLGLAQAATENSHQVKPHIRVASEYTAQ